MAMSLGKAEINVTPLIDVLVVLIIIFMVVLPQHSVGLPAIVPQPNHRASGADRLEPDGSGGQPARAAVHAESEDQAAEYRGAAEVAIDHNSAGPTVR